MTPERIVVVGGSVGGVRAVSELRGQGFGGEIVLVGPEAAAPYDLPPLSKQVLLGSWPPEKASLGDPAARWGATVVEDRASALDVAGHQVRLSGGDRIGYDALVIATGATPRELPGTRPSGVHVLRTMADCMALRESLDRGGPLVVVGGGFVGAEVASSAAARGIDASIVEALPTPMARVLGERAGGLLADLHERHGVRVRCGAGVAEVRGDGRVDSVLLSDGSRIAADTVAVGIGVVPNTDWLASAGLVVDDGVVCDEYCAAAGAADVYAIGDVARWYDVHVERSVRIEHWTNATEQANTVAHNIVHPRHRRTHRARPYFWSDQHGVKIQLVGYVDAAAEVTIVRRQGATERVAALYHDADRVAACLTINWPRALATVRRAFEETLPAPELADRLRELPAQAARQAAAPT